MKRLDVWVVYIDRDSGDEFSQQSEVFLNEEKAMKYYNELKRELKEYVADTGFTGDEMVVIAKAEKLLTPVTEVNEDEVSFHFEWEEFEQEICDYCNSIEKATSASPRHNYKYCPMCGRKRG